MDFENHREALWRYILARGVPRADAEDIFQEVCLALWQTSDHANPRSLAFSVARNKVVDFFRRQKLASATFAEETEPEGEACSDNTEWEWELERLLGGSGINEDQKHAVVLHYLLGFSVRECAQITQVSAETVKSRLFHAKNKIRRFRRQTAPSNTGATP